MILLTTSLRPTRRMRTLCHDLASSIPDVIRVNRGKMSLRGVGERAAELGTEKIVMIDRWKGEAGRIRFFKIGERGLSQVLPCIYVRGVKLKREFKVTRRTFLPLFINGTDEGNRDAKRLRENMSVFFDVPILDPDEESTQYQAVMRFAANPSGFLQLSFYAVPQGLEIGPCITVSHVVWEN